MSQTFQSKADAHAWLDHHDPLAPKIGDLAPDFELCDTNGQNSIRLSTLCKNKPVALVFGSFTWPPFVREAVSLRDLYAQYNEQIQFLVIYIREAHPENGWKLKDTGIYDPTTIEERRQVAGQCEVAMQYGIQTYVDEMDDATMIAYAAWPERLYLIDTDQQVLYPGARGPGGFSPTELKEAIEDTLKNQKP
jgi:peroxiredoxin